MKIKLIVGLANPGTKYVATRHNYGSFYIKLLANRYLQTLKENSKFYGYTCKIPILGNNIYLLIPNTFMNLSGKAVAAIANFYHISPEEILVAHDELNMLPGNVKIKINGGHNGHNGLKDIIAHLGGNQFYRLRIGIGHPGNKNEVVYFVLNKPPTEEQKLINSAIDEAVRCTDIIINKIP
ncbi:Peptidyl-tRNA hydrolase [secondary endosymbiont of Trabutina mannipara]|uniref:Peptidyl-tRNA hydrolase n=1 Tax=secondary endosymbiont of Trabutina mannipara TaxID=1835721 RepID=A0A1C3L3S9_9ENTR|nr:aminoacyl-tRNA hydrolase [secondary endosymbiont of Trabutina mannipara]SBT81943.1 Peptidyl-tRNA hydrolase [secondary endosymbiont of Trabutina mannipara]